MDQGKTSETGWYPKSEAELRFYLKHIIQKVMKSDPTKDDKLFKATNIKFYNRKKSNHGYNPGEDRGVYESKDEQGDAYKKWRKDKFDDRETTRKIVDKKAPITKFSAPKFKRRDPVRGVRSNGVLMNGEEQIIEADKESFSDKIKKMRERNPKAYDGSYEAKEKAGKDAMEAVKLAQGWIGG